MTPRQLADELGHHDYGCVIKRFLHNPDDGRRPFEGHPWWKHWHLTPEQANRVRQRFT